MNQNISKNLGELDGAGGTKWLPLSKLSLGTPYSAEYLSLLARKRKLEAIKVEGVWYSQRDIVDSYAKLQSAKKDPLEYSDPNKLLLHHILGRRESVLLKRSEKPFELRKKYKSYSVLAEEAMAFVPKEHPTIVWNKTLAITLSAIFLFNLSGFLYSQLAGHALSADLHERFAAAASYNTTSASALGAVESSLDFLLSGFNRLRNFAVGGLENATRTLPGVGIKPTFTYGTPYVAEAPTYGTPAPLPEIAKAVLETAPSISYDSLRSDLKTELESYLNTRLSQASSPITIYQSSPVYNQSFRNEILLADTRPTITRQSSSDIDHQSSLISGILDGGAFANAHLTNATISGPSGYFNALNFGAATGTSLYLSGNATIDGNLNVGSNTVTLGQLISTRVPTLAHVFSPSWPAGTSNASDATIYINPATAAADTNIFAAAVGGSVKFLVDAEGDVYANNLILSGSTSQGATTIAGNLIVQDSTTLGDAASDLATLNSQLLVNASTTLQNLTFRNATGTNATTTTLYVSGLASTTNLRANAAVLGNVGIGTDPSNSAYRLTVNGGYSQVGSDANLFTGRVTSHVVSGENAFTVSNASVPGGALWNLVPVTNGGIETDLRFYEENASAARLTLQAGGNVGIGTTTPGSLLHVQGGPIQIGNASGNGGAYMKFLGASTHKNFIIGNQQNASGFEITPSTANGGSTFTTPALFIDDSSNVGINDTVPAAKLHISGSGATAAATTEAVLVLDRPWNAGVSFGKRASLNIGAADAASDGPGRLDIAVNPATSGLTVDSTTLPSTTVASFLGSGNVGIGTTNPDTIGHLKYSSADNTILRLETSDTGASSETRLDWVLSDTSANRVQAGYIGLGKEQSWTSTAATRDSYMKFVTALNGSATEQMRITSAGNVGIGTTNPTYNLQLKTSGGLGFLQTTSDFATGVGSTLLMQPGAATGNTYYYLQSTITGQNANGNLVLQPNGGNVGIGTNNPLEKLEVDGGIRINGAAVLGAPYTDTGIIDQVGSDLRFLSMGPDANTPGGFLFYQAANDNEPNRFAMAIDSSGNVGIGATNPGGKLTIASPYSDTIASRKGLQFDADGGSGYWSMGLSSVGNFSLDSISGTAANALTVLASNGNVGIGNTNPSSYKLQVNNASDTDYSPTTGIPNVITSFYNPTSGALNNTFIALGGENSGEVYLGAVQNAGNTRSDFAIKLYDGSDRTEKFRITSGGAVGIGLTNPATYSASGLTLQNAGNGDWGMVMRQTHASNPLGIYLNYTAASPNGTGNSAFRFDDSTTMRFEVRSNGGIANYSGNDVILSDERMKNLYGDAPSEIERFAQLKFVLGEYKDDPLVVKDVMLTAQQVQTIYPELVTIFDDERGTLGVRDGELALHAFKSIQDVYLMVKEIIALSGAFKDGLIAWLGNTANGITDFFANRVHTKELCVSDDSGETCITRSQLNSLLAGAGQSTSGTNGGSVDSGSSGETSGETGGETEFTPIEIVDSGDSSASSTPETIDNTGGSGEVSDGGAGEESGGGEIDGGSVDGGADSGDTDNSVVVDGSGEVAPELSPE